METAEHREPYESRGSRTVLGAPGGEIPPGNSTIRVDLDTRRSMSASSLIVLQNLFCTGDQKFCGLQARLSCKDVRDLIASR